MTLVSKFNIDVQAFSKRLNEACDLENLPRKNKGRGAVLAKLLGVSTRSASGWLDGEYLPTKKRRQKLSQLLRVSLEYLEGGVGSIRPNTNTKQDKSSNHYLPNIPFRKICDYINNRNELTKEHINIDIRLSDQAFITHQVGDSMSPLFNNNAQLIVEPKSEYNDGCFVIAAIINTNEIILRQYLVTSQNKVFLSAFNTKYPPYEVNQNIRIIAQVIYSASTHT